MRNHGRSKRLTIGVVAALAAALLTMWWVSGAGPAHSGDPRSDAAPSDARPGTAGAVGAASRQAVAPAAGRGYFAAPVGSEFGYRFAATVRSRVEMKLAEQPASQELVVRLGGTLIVLVVARRDQEIIAQVRIAGATGSQGVAGREDRSSLLEEQLALPVLVRMREDGDVLGFAFDAKSNGYVNNLLRSVLCGFRFVAPQAAPASWEGEEADPTGIAAVRYERLGGADGGDERVRRTKLAYRAAPSQKSDLALLVEVRGGAQARLSAELGWLRSAQVDETLGARAPAASVRSTTEYQASLELATQAVRAATDLPAASWDAAWTSLDGAADTQAIAEGTEREMSEVELGGATLASLVPEILALAAAVPLDSAALTAAAHQLAVLVRLRPQALEELGRLLPSAPPFAADVLLGAIGAAGTDSAQRFVAGVAGDPQATPHLRQSALDSMIQLHEPNDAVLASVRSLVADADASPRLRDNGLLVLGALGSRQPRSETTGRDGLVAELVGYEERARAERRLEHWLHALGNTRHVGTLPAVERYLGHEDMALRHAAVSALRQLDAPRATAALLERARGERDPRVRALAIEGLAQRRDAAALEYVAGVLARDPQVDARHAAVAGLGRQLPVNEAVRPLLQRAAQGDAAREVRDLAAQLLAPR